MGTNHHKEHTHNTIYNEVDDLFNLVVTMHLTLQ
jgi:hypothetical protein